MARRSCRSRFGYWMFLRLCGKHLWYRSRAQKSNSQQSRDATDSFLFWRGRYPLRIYSKIPNIQIHSIRQNLSESIFPSRQILAQRKSEYILGDVPPLNHHRFSILRNLLAKQVADRFEFPLPAFHRQTHQFDFRTGFSRPAALSNRRDLIRVRWRFPEIEFRPFGIDTPCRFCSGDLDITLIRNDRNRG